MAFIDDLLGETLAPQDMLMPHHEGYDLSQDPGWDPVNMRRYDAPKLAIPDTGPTSGHEFAEKYPGLLEPAVYDLLNVALPLDSIVGFSEEGKITAPLIAGLLLSGGKQQAVNYLGKKAVTKIDDKVAKKVDKAVKDRKIKNTKKAKKELTDEFTGQEIDKAVEKKILQPATKKISSQRKEIDELKDAFKAISDEQAVKPSSRGPIGKLYDFMKPKVQKAAEFGFLPLTKSAPIRFPKKVPILGGRGPGAPVYAGLFQSIMGEPRPEEYTWGGQFNQAFPAGKLAYNLEKAYWPSVAAVKGIGYGLGYPVEKALSALAAIDAATVPEAEKEKKGTTTLKLSDKDSKKYNIIKKNEENLKKLEKKYKNNKQPIPTSLSEMLKAIRDLDDSPKKEEGKIFLKVR